MPSASSCVMVCGTGGCSCQRSCPGYNTGVVGHIGDGDPALGSLFSGLRSVSIERSLRRNPRGRRRRGRGYSTCSMVWSRGRTRSRPARPPMFPGRAGAGWAPPESPTPARTGRCRQTRGCGWRASARSIRRRSSCSSPRSASFASTTRSRGGCRACCPTATGSRSAQLLTMRSGLIDNNDLIRTSGARASPPHPGRGRRASGAAARDRRPHRQEPGHGILADLVDQVRRLAAAAVRAGHRFHYSNIGYDILGLIAGRAGGKPLPALYRERIFQPLGLDATAYDPQGPISGPTPTATGSTRTASRSTRPTGTRASAPTAASSRTRWTPRPSSPP